MFSLIFITKKDPTFCDQHADSSFVYIVYFFKSLTLYCLLRIFEGKFVWLARPGPAHLTALEPYLDKIGKISSFAFGHGGGAAAGLIAKGTIY